MAVLVSFCWMASGAAVRAECRSAQADPIDYLLQRVDDPRLSLSPQARQRLRAAVEESAAHRARRAQACPAPTAAIEPVGEVERAVGALEVAERGSADGSPVTVEHVKEQLRGVRASLGASRDRLVQDLAATEAALAAQGTADVIRERAQAMRRTVEDRMGLALDALDAAETASTVDAAQGAARRAREQLEPTTTAPPDTALDPSNLPVRTPDGDIPAPRLSDAAYEVSAADTAAPAPALALAAPAPDAWWGPALAWAQPAPDELLPNEDAQITPAIQDLAISLGRDPLRIYDWVRNTIEFVPTYGSVQGSRMTLEARRGNAFDIASLLIALLRASGVAARYVTGTVEVPADVVMNWLGGVPTPRVAQQLLGQGGIANVGLVAGGATTHIRLEHAWVEAWIDWIPGRGAAHRAGDTWVALDASLKQHAVAAPSTLLRDVPLDLQALSDQLLASGEYDPALRRVANVDQELIFPALESWETQARAYMDANAIPDSPVGVLGGSTIVAQTSTVLPGSLPYRVIARGPGMATLSPSLRHQVRLDGYATVFGRAFGDRSFTYRLSLPALNSRRLGLRFDPATAADAATLESIRSSNAASIPLYLVNVVPVVTLDGAPVATGPAIRMGTTQLLDVVLERPGGGSTTVGYDNLFAGDEIVLGITGNGVAQGVVQARFDAVPPDTAAESLHQIQLHYWMQTDALNALTARTLGVHTLRLPSVGVFSSPLSVSTIFGAPYRGAYQSRSMDVKLSLLGAAGPDAPTVRRFMQQAGYQGSFMEAEAFDQFDHGEIKRGISAVHLLADATTVGIPIYTVTQANAAAVMPLLALDASVERDVANAIAAGKTVIVPGANLDRGPWRGVGYVVQDPQSGAGAYLISGGLNGGGVWECLPDLVPILVVILAIILLAILLYLLLLALAAALAAAPEIAFALILLVALLVSASPSGPTTA